MPSLALFLFPALLFTACSSRGGAARNPASPTPVADPAPAPATTAEPRGNPGSEGAGGLPRHEAVPMRPDQAPLVRIREALLVDSLLGRRVRVSGRCTGFGQGRRAGFWTLEDEESKVEVRGLVPPSCGA